MRNLPSGIVNTLAALEKRESRRGFMSDPFSMPNCLPAARHQPRSDESLREVRFAHVTWACELRYHREWGAEARILRDGELVIGRRFDT